MTTDEDLLSLLNNESSQYQSGLDEPQHPQLEIQPQPILPRNNETEQLHQTCQQSQQSIMVSQQLRVVEFQAGEQVNLSDFLHGMYLS